MIGPIRPACGYFPLPIALGSPAASSVAKGGATETSPFRRVLARTTASHETAASTQERAVERAPAVSAHVAPPTPRATVYTRNPNEIGVVKTPLTTPEVTALIRKHWPGLSEAGARTLASQWAAETGFGKNCYSYNFGNVKCTDAKQGHMYLKGTWEVAKSDADADRMRAAGGRDADDAFKKRLGLPADMRVVVFDTPHPASRFRAFKTADEGMAFWVELKQKIAAKAPGYVAALERGDVATVARVLAKARYATMPELQVRVAMSQCRAIIERQLAAKA